MLGPDRLDDPSRDAVLRFVDELRRLRLLAGAPSLNRLVALTGRVARPLARSTISDKLNGKSLPEWEFVVAFVTACAAHAEAAGSPLPGHLIDLDGWDTAHLRMLRAVDQDRSERRLVGTAHAELRGRDSRGAAAPAVEAVPDGPAIPRPDGLLIPRQLPAAGRHFTGRAAELAYLTGLLDAADGGRAIVIATIDGTAGVGKTSLVVHWAHQVADRFPHGQLYVNLRGFDATGTPVNPEDAVRGFLDAFGIPPDRIPVSVDARVAMYRSLVSGRRMVIVLDDAASAEQVRPLLPGSPGCVVVVTSRNRLTSLIVKEGAHPLMLGLMSNNDARELMARTLGPDRVVAELSSVDGIVARCSWLPLALTVVAARAASHPRFPLTVLENELRETPVRLDAFDGGEADTDVRAVFSWSQRWLRPPAARLFRLLGLHPGPDISAAAGVSLAGAPPAEVRRSFAELAGAHLVEEDTPGRFACHELLRAYAAELVLHHDSEPDRRDAVRRLLDHYVHSALAADRRLDPHRTPVAGPAPRGGVAPEDPVDSGAALAWFTAEHAVLLAALRLAVDAGLDREAWWLAWAMESYFDHAGHWPDWLAAQRMALDAAHRLQDPVLVARTEHDLARVAARLGRYDEADGHLHAALRDFERLDDRTGQADVCVLSAEVFEQQGRHRRAISQLHQALRLFRAAEHPAGQAGALSLIGWNYALLDDQPKALSYCRSALEMQRNLGDHRREASTWGRLGYAHHRMGSHQQAAGCLRRALELFRVIGDRYSEAETLVHLGDAHDAAGDFDSACDAWQQALAVLDPLGHPDAERVRARLSPTVVPLPQAVLTLAPAATQV